jgi:DNA-binding LacI/PurR family transcriptional regulator
MATESTGRVTAHDVAARAGVSQPTVSLVLSGNPRARVAAKTRERVVRAAEELGYRPNLLARGLVLRRSFAIGLVVPDLGNPFFVDVVRGAERVASASGYVLLLCDGREGTAAAHLESLLTRQVDGVILDASGLAAAPEDLLASLNVVLIEEPSQRLAWVGSDAEAAGRVAAEHLLALGHRDFGMVGPASQLHAFRMRERGFFRAVAGAGGQIRSPWLRRVPATVEGGAAAIKALLAQPERPTAVFCINDLVAIGALKSCLSAGIRIPGELSLMGCDDIEMARLVTPELSTVTVPAREIGARAARRLLQQLEPSAPQRSPARVLPVRLAARGTTGPVIGSPQP